MTEETQTGADQNGSQANAEQGTGQDAGNQGGQQAQQQQGGTENAGGQQSKPAAENKDAGGGKKDTVVAPAWPEEWRKQAAGGDEKVEKLLTRYNSPAEVAKALAEANRMIRSGELKKGLEKDATAEQIKQWREDNGIPESPDKYELPEGLTIGEDDKPLVDGFRKVAHDNNLSPDAVKAALSWYYQSQEEQQAARSDEDNELKTKTEDALRSEWGGEYRANINRLDSFLTNRFGKEAYEGLKNARLGDGTPIFSHPTIVKQLTALARETNPTATITEQDMQRGTTRIAELEKMMGSKEWYKNNALQAEYRGLIEARDRYKNNA